MMPTPRLAFATVAGIMVYLGLAVLGWGGFAAFFSHPALSVVAIATLVLAVITIFSRVNLSAGEREDRDNRWVIAALVIIGLLEAYLPAYTDRKEFWTLDGDSLRWLGVLLFIVGGVLRIWPVFVLGHRFSGLVASSPVIRWSRPAFTASSGIPAIWGCSSMHWGGLSRFVPRSAYCSRCSLSCRSSLASVRKKRCCTRSSGLNMMLTAPVRRD